MVYRDNMRKVLIGRAGDWIARTSSPRFVIFIAFTLAMMAAYLCSLMLIQISLGGFGVRFGLSFILGYLVYLLWIGIWFHRKPILNTRMLLDGAPPEIQTKSPLDASENDFNVGDLSDVIRQSRPPNDPRGLVVLLTIVGILGVAIVMFHWVRYARWYLGEVLVAGGKVSHRICSPATGGSFFIAPAQQSFWVAVILLLHYTMIGVLLQMQFPTAVTIGDVLHLL